MTKRCKLCGVKMNETEIDGKAVRQCPVCGFVVKKEEGATTSAQPSSEESS